MNKRKKFCNDSVKLSRAMKL